MFVIGYMTALQPIFGFIIPSRPSRLPKYLLTVSYLQVKGCITGFGQPTWRETHSAAFSTAPAVQVRHTALPCNLC